MVLGQTGGSDSIEPVDEGAFQGRCQELPAREAQAINEERHAVAQHWQGGRRNEEYDE